MASYRFVYTSSAFVGTSYLELNARRAFVVVRGMCGDESCIETDGRRQEADRCDDDGNCSDDPLGLAASVRSRLAVMRAR